MVHVALIWKSYTLKINRRSTDVGGHKFAFKMLKDPRYLDLEYFCF